MMTSCIMTQRDESSPTMGLFRETISFRASATRNYSHCPSDFHIVSRLFTVLPGFPCAEKAQEKMVTGIKLWTKPICSVSNWSLCQQLPKVADWRKNNLRIEGKLFRISLYDGLFWTLMLCAGAVRGVLKVRTEILLHKSWFAACHIEFCSFPCHLEKETHISIICHLCSLK